MEINNETLAGLVLCFFISGAMAQSGAANLELSETDRTAVFKAAGAEVGQKDMTTSDHR